MNWDRRASKRSAYLWPTSKLHRKGSIRLALQLAIVRVMLETVVNSTDIFPWPELIEPVPFCRWHFESGDWVSGREWFIYALWQNWLSASRP